VTAPGPVGPGLLAGLTGGIASGKSTVAGMFRELEVPVVDADAIVHDLLGPGGRAVDPVLQLFGERVLGPEGGIDRTRLAELVFRDPDERRRLEAAVHPLVFEESLSRLEQVANETGAEFVLYDAALLVETGRHEAFQRVVVVTVPAEVQLERLMARDGIDEVHARRRLEAQMALTEKAAVADYLVDNGGSWTDTRREVRRVLALLREDAACLREGRPLPVRRGGRQT
jgi:dephospho-CoA kinase